MADISDKFRRDGFVVLRSFYEARTEIEPIQRSIYEDHKLRIKRHALLFMMSTISR